MDHSISIFIADDHKLFAHSLKSMIEDQTDYLVTKIVTNGRHLLQALNGEKPNLLILDINMPELDGLEVLPRIKLLFPEIKIFVVSYISEPTIISKVKQLGANGYFVKDEDPNFFVEMLHLVVNGEKFFPKQQLSQIQSATQSISKFQFTDREIDVLKLIKQNHATAQIANLLFISENTVKTHRKNICSKLNTSDFKIVYQFAIENF